MEELKHVNHTFEPVFDSRSSVLILGTFPSVKSREGQFYYHHPRNRFWSVLARVTGETPPSSIPEKKELLLRHGVAVWDVISSCDIHGSSDSSIRNVVPNDMSVILDAAPVRKIFANGDKAYRLYEQYCMKSAGRPILKLPSTSPANAAYSLERLAGIWEEALSGILKG